MNRDAVPNEPLTHQLRSEADRAAVDALLGSGHGAVPSTASGAGTTDPGVVSRYRALSSLLGGLDLPVVGGSPRLSDTDDGSASALVDVTMARVMRAGQQGLAGRIEPAVNGARLSDADAAEVDALVASRWQTGDQDRSRRVAALCALVDASGPIGAPAERRALVERTLAAVSDASSAARRGWRISPERQVEGPVRGGIRLADLGAIAAVMLIAVGVAWPFLTAAREQGRLAACATNMQGASLGLTLFAADHQNALPMAQASFLGGTWWDVGRPQRSHSANLYRLVTDRYASLADLSCPGNGAAPTTHTSAHATDWRRPEEVSFSYQLPTPRRAGWGASPALVVLTDRSPVVPRARRGEVFDALGTSPNHRGHGQHALFSDGRLEFFRTPLLPSGDNLWLPGSGGASEARTLTGREQPASEQDAFVGP